MSRIRRLSWRQRLDAAVRSLLYDPMQLVGRNRRISQCPICGFQGRFWSFGNPPRRNAQCRRCGAKERHRLMALWARRHDVFREKHILHFAPDPGEQALIEGQAVYETADLDRADVDHRVDVCATGLTPASYDVIVCNHVFEHVEDDGAAIKELYRLLAPGGLAIVMVPINTGLDRTYENPAIRSRHDRHQHFGQKDHVRLYGRDYPERLRAAGFTVEQFDTNAEDCVRYGLIPGEPLFVAHKSGGVQTETLT